GGGGRRISWRCGAGATSSTRSPLPTSRATRGHASATPGIASAEPHHRRTTGRALPSEIIRPGRRAPIHCESRVPGREWQSAPDTERPADVLCDGRDVTRRERRERRHTFIAEAHGLRIVAGRGAPNVRAVDAEAVLPAVGRRAVAARAVAEVQVGARATELVAQPGQVALDARDLHRDEAREARHAGAAALVH